MRLPVAAFFIALLTAATASAQFHGAFGVSAASPNYDTSNEKFRISPGLEVLMERGRVGIHVATDWTNRQTGTVSAWHPNVSWRVPLDEDFSALIGAGASFIEIESNHTRESTWNAEIELNRRFNRAEVFLRIRQYSYSAGEFRGQQLGGSGPTLGGGVRFNLF